MSKTINNEKPLDLVEYMKEWIKGERDERFWETVKKLNLLLLLSDISDQTRSRMVHGIVLLVKTAQMAAFRDGLNISKMNDTKGEGIRFRFNNPDAINIAYIVQRNQENQQFMHDMLLHARTLERLLCSSKDAKP